MSEGHELVDGELVDVSGNTLRHNSIQVRLSSALLHVVDEGRLGTVVAEQEYDFNGNAHGPDVSFFGLEKLSLIDPDKRVQRFVPDLAIEIVPANDTHDSLAAKRRRYRNCGTTEVWIVSPKGRDVTVYSARGDRILYEDSEVSTDLIPGFRMLVKDLLDSK